MGYDYDAFYRKYPVNQHDQPERHLKIAELVKGSVLDIGCGAGMLADYFFGAYTGVDISSVAIENAKKIRRKDARFVIADPTKGELPVYDRFDTIVMSEFLEHLEDEGVLWANVKSRLNPNGRVIISVPNDHAFDCDEHVRWFTIPELRRKLQPFGRVQFHNWAGAKGQIIATVDFGQENLNSLSLVMIAKNEELGLERAILSAIERVQNVVIAVDNSSTDKTLEIAKRYADTVKQFDWQDDFAWARNFAHEGVETDWILFLDGHEYIEKCENLDEFLKRDADTILCTVELETGSQIRNPRIYRNGIQFHGRVHELQIAKNRIFCPGVLIKHGRIGGQSIAATLERDQQRDDQIPRIMGAELKKNPQNIRASFHLALHAQSKGEFKQAIKYQNKYLKYSVLHPERWFVYFNRALCFLALNGKFRGFWAVFQADSETPGRWEIAKLRGLIFFQAGKYEKAIAAFVESFKINRGDETYKPWAREDAGTWNMIGECFCQLGFYQKAQIAFDEVVKCSKDEKLKELAGKRSALMAQMAPKGRV